MKAIVYNEFGGRDVLKKVEISKPVIKAKQVLIQVKAVSINPMDWKIRKGEMKLMSGSHFPKMIGAEFAGIIHEVGTEVGEHKAGDQVFGAVNAMKEGALAEYIAIDEDNIWPKPQGLSFTEAATIPIAGGAAIAALEKIGDIKAETEILINGVSGGFGMYLLQLLNQQSATVTTVSNTKGVAFAKKWGALHTIDYTKENVLDLSKVYDVVVDLSGKMEYESAKKIMKAHSSFINPTPKPLEILTTPILDVFTAKKHIVLLSNPSGKNMKKLMAAISHGLEIEISKIFKLDQAQEAYQYAEKGGYVGKVVIEVD